jgi:hypothetical protein
MSNLTDLLPAGAGGKQVDFVASGTLSSGQTVVLNSNGTVSTPSSQSASLSSPAAINTDVIKRSDSTYDSSENRTIVAFKNDSPNTLSVVAGEMSGSSITWGTEVSSGSSFDANQVSIATNNNGTFAVIYTNSSVSNRLFVVIGTLSGSSITLGTPVQVTTNGPLGAITYDSIANKFLIVYHNASIYGTAVVCSVSGTTPTLGTPVVYRSSTSLYPTCCYDSQNGKIAIFGYIDTSSSYGFAGTISGTSFSVGAQATLSKGIYSAFNFLPKCVFDTSSNTSIFVFSSDGDSNKGFAATGTISGTSLSFGTAIQFTIGDETGYSPAVTHDAAANKIVVAYDVGDGNVGKYAVGTVSGGSISFDTPIQFESTQEFSNSLSYDTTNTKVVFTYIDEGGGDDLKYVVLANAYSTYTRFIGITDAAISDTASGSVTIKGGISTNVTGLTANSTYYVQTNGTLSTTTSTVLAGKALSSTSINLDYTT